MHLYCVIDIGSNTIRLVIYTLEDGQLRQALSSKATAGLAGFVEDGALSEEGIERMLGVLRRFRGVLSLLPVASFKQIGAPPGYRQPFLQGIKRTEGLIFQAFPPPEAPRTRGSHSISGEQA